MLWSIAANFAAAILCAGPSSPFVSIARRSIRCASDFSSKPCNRCQSAILASVKAAIAEPVEVVSCHHAPPCWLGPAVPAYTENAQRPPSGLSAYLPHATESEDWRDESEGQRKSVELALWWGL